MLADHRAVGPDKFVDRLVIRGGGNGRESGVSFEDDVRPEIRCCDMQRHPGIPPHVPGLGPGVGDRDQDHAVDDGEHDVGQLWPAVAFDGRQHAFTQRGGVVQGLLHVHVSSLWRLRAGRTRASDHAEVRACAGSTFAAREAGNSPAITPTRTVLPRPAAMAHSGIEIGHPWLSA